MTLSCIRRFEAKFFANICSSWRKTCLFNIEFNTTLGFERFVDPVSGFVTFLVPFTGLNDITETFVASSNEIYIKIENSNAIETETVKITNVSLLESIEYEFQFSGANLPFCSLDN